MEVLYKIIKSNNTIDIIRVKHNNEADATTKLTAYFSKSNDKSLIPGLVLWALHDNAPKSYKTVVIFEDGNSVNKIQVKRKP